MVQRLMRDIYSPETDELIMDCPEQLEQTNEFLDTMLPGKFPKLTVYEGEDGLFVV